MHVSNMSSARSTVQRVNSISNKAEVASRSGVIGKGTRGSIGKYSPSTAMQKSKIPTNIAQSVRAEATTAVIVHPGDSSKQTILEDPTLNVSALQASPVRRITSKNVPNSTSLCSPRTRTSVASTNNSPTKRRLLENQYSMKKKKYEILKKELVEKQKTAHDVYNDIMQLRDKVIASGAKDPGKIEEISLLRADRTDHNQSTALSAHDGGCGEQPNNINAITNEFMKTMESKFQEIPIAFLELCREALANRAKILSWLMDLGYEVTSDSDTVKQLETYRKEGAVLEARLEEASKTQDELIADLLRKTSALWEDRENYRTYVKKFENTDDGTINELRDKLDVTLANLKAEYEKTNELKERANATDADLQKAKNKIQELECHVANSETKIRQLQEQATKDVQRMLKKSEGPVNKMEKQRDALESWPNDPKRKFASKELEAERTAKETMQKLEALLIELKKEKEKRQQAEIELSEMQDHYRKLEDKSQQLCEFAQKTKDLAAADESRTNKEDRLFDELQTARMMLTKQEEKIVQLQHEKEEIVAVLHRASQDNGEARQGVQDNLAAELATKINELHSLVREHTWLQKNYKTLQEKSDNLEQQLEDLHGRLHAQSKESKTGWGTNTVELHQQISDLRNNLMDLARHNEELETALTQKQLELEQRDRVMREQSKVLKVRDELIGLLKGKDRQKNGDMVNFQNVYDEDNRDVDQVNEHIAARAEELQELYSTLESKQIQVMQLEKMVKQMEDQQDRAQAQRTRLENRIAQLELALQEKSKDHRYVTEEQIALPNLPCILEHEAQLIHSSSNRSHQQTLTPRPTSTTPTPQHCRYSYSFRVKPIDDRFSLTTTESPRNECDSIRNKRTYVRQNRVNEEISSREDRVGSTGQGSTDDIDETCNDEIRESFYNWLMKTSVSESMEKFANQSDAFDDDESFYTVVSSSSETFTNSWRGSIGFLPRGSREFVNCSRDSRIIRVRQYTA